MEESQGQEEGGPSVHACSACGGPGKGDRASPPRRITADGWGPLFDRLLGGISFDTISGCCTTPTLITLMAEVGGQQIQRPKQSCIAQQRERLAPNGYPATSYHLATSHPKERQLGLMHMRGSWAALWVC